MIHGKEDKKEESRREHVHTDRMQVTRAPALHIFGRQKARLEKKVFCAAEKITVEMGDVVKEVFYQPAECLFRLDVFLATNVTVPANYVAAAIEANLYFSLRMM